jgi:hypothetical protein
VTKPAWRTATPLLPAYPSLAEDLKFYTAHLGFTLLWEGGGMAGIRRDAITFNLVESDNRNWADNASVSIGVGDLDDLYEDYRGAPARITALEQKPWGRRAFHMILPSGVCLQFFEQPLAES